MAKTRVVGGRLKVLPVAVACALGGAVAWAAEAAPGTPETGATLSAVVVSAEAGGQRPTEKTGDYTVKAARGATGMDLPPRQTPQAVSVVTRAQMDDFRLNSVNEALEGSTGVVVEKVETDRTYYSARGFDITNFQIDGLGMPMLFGLTNGDIDTALYDRVEVLRGANGLMSGIGNPSATVNFVRKRPTSAFQSSMDLSYGSWNNRRLQGDVSGALNESKTIRGRLTVAGQDKDSYLDRYNSQRSLVSAMVEADLNDATTLTAGFTYHRNAPKGGLWGALPLYYSDGSATHYDRSTSTSADWSAWSIETRSELLELVHRLQNDWEAKLSYTRADIKERSRLFYVYGTPDPVTGLGLFAYPSAYSNDAHQDQFDLRVSGPFTLAGRRHEAIFGTSYGRSKVREESAYGQGIGTPLPSLNDWTGNYPEPTFDAAYDGSELKDTQRRVYASTRLNLAEPAHLILGASQVRATAGGSSYGVAHDTVASKLTPYAGLTYDLNEVLSAYASYTGIFNPQYQLDRNFQRLDPARGKSLEAGLKGEFFARRLNASLSVFDTRQKGLATDDGYVGVTAVYKGADAHSQGYELELSGAVTPGIKLSAGYTALTLKDQDGRDTRTFTPRHQANLSSSWKLDDRFTLGARLRWQGDIHRDVSDTVTIKQKAYALLDLMTRYDIDKQWSVAANLYNVTNKKYITSLYWEQGYYGAPLNGMVTLSWKY